jgi:hypothetical protein
MRHAFHCAKSNTPRVDYSKALTRLVLSAMILLVLCCKHNIAYLTRLTSQSSRATPLCTIQTSNLLSKRVLEGIDSITLWIIQLHDATILQGQTPLLRHKIASPAPPPTPQSDLPLPLGALDPEADIDASMHLVDLALDPRIFARKVYLVA